MKTITRRRFVVGTGQSLAALSLVSPGMAWAQTGETPVMGGTLRFSQAGVPPGYDPQKWWNAQAGMVMSMVSEPLIQTDAYTGERIPRLATGEPTLSDDGLVYTFTLRPGVKFHGDNGTMTADDVKFSYERLMSSELGAETGFIFTSVPFKGLAAFLDGSADEIEGIRAVDDLTLEVTLDRQDSAFLPAFTYTTAGILPRSYYEGKSFEEVNSAPVGTGPFMLGETDKSSFATLVRHPGYWEEGHPYLDAVDITFNVEPQLAMLRIQNGEQDLMLEPIPAASINQIRNDPTLEAFYHEAAQNDCQWLSLPTEMAPFDDVRVRRAIAMAIDKEKLVKVLKGTGVPATGTIFSPKSRYAEEGVAYPYDPEGARALLAEAGYPEGFSAPFWYQAQPPYSDMGPSIIEDLAQVGITAQAEAKIYDQFVQETNAGPPAMIIFAWEDAYGHGSYIADAGFRSGAIEDGCCNYARIAEDRIDELAVEGHSADVDVSDEAYREIGRLIVRDIVSWIPLVYPVRADIANARVGGFETAVYPSGQTKRFEKYWIEDA